MAITKFGFQHSKLGRLKQNTNKENKNLLFCLLREYADVFFLYFLLFMLHDWVY